MNPANAKFVCGAECGLAEIGTLSNGDEHWRNASGTPTVVTSGPSPMLSERCFRFNVSGTLAYLSHSFATAIVSPATMVARFNVYFASLPSGDTLLCSSVGQTYGVFFQASDSKIYARTNGSVSGATGITVTTGQWYRIDVKIVRDATETTDVSVDGVACGQASRAGSATSIDNPQIGVMGNVTADVYFDDFIVSGVSGDFPIGAGTVAGLYPNADGTHTYNNAGDFGKGSGAGTNLATPSSSETTAYQSLTNPLSTSIATNFVGAKASDTTLTGDRPAEFLRFGFENLPADATTVNGVMLVATCHAASATSNNHRLHIDDGTNTPPAALINADLSETTITVPSAIATVAGDSAAWTVAKANATFVRFSSSDVNPDAYLDGLCLEVDYVATPPEQVTRPYGTDPYRSLLAH